MWFLRFVLLKPHIFFALLVAVHGLKSSTQRPKEEKTYSATVSR